MELLQNKRHRTLQKIEGALLLPYEIVMGPREMALEKSLRKKVEAMEPRVLEEKRIVALRSLEKTAVINGWALGLSTVGILATSVVMHNPQISIGGMVTLLGTGVNMMVRGYTIDLMKRRYNLIY